jgi:hypothetical protein
MIKFTNTDEFRNITHEISPDLPWYEVADLFVDFLRGCGYHVTRYEVADYFNEGREYSDTEYESFGQAYNDYLETEN